MLGTHLDEVLQTFDPMKYLLLVCVEVLNDKFFLLILCIHNIDNLAICLYSESCTAITYIIKCIFNPECAVDFLCLFLPWLTCVMF